MKEEKRSKRGVRDERRSKEGRGAKRGRQTKRKKKVIQLENEFEGYTHEAHLFIGGSKSKVSNEYIYKVMYDSLNILIYMHAWLYV